MKNLTIMVDDELVSQTSITLLENYLQEQLEFLRLQSLSRTMQKAIEDEDLNLEQELKKAKENAWKEYKSTYLDGII